MAKYAVARTDLMYGTDVRDGLVSVKYMGADGNTPAEIENGSVVRVKGLMEGEREVHVGVDMSANDSLKDVVLLVAPEVMYDERKKNFDEYINEEGKSVRGYRFHPGSIFSLTKEAFVDAKAPKVNDIVELANGTKLATAESATGATVVGKVIEIEIAGRHTYYAIEVGEANV